eukprot:14094264-Alexandrium_andersonii.AAC.1
MEAGSVARTNKKEGRKTGLNGKEIKAGTVHSGARCCARAATLARVLADKKAPSPQRRAADGSP